MIHPIGHVDYLILYQLHTPLLFIAILKFQHLKLVPFLLESAKQLEHLPPQEFESLTTCHLTPLIFGQLPSDLINSKQL